MQKSKTPWDQARSRMQQLVLARLAPRSKARPASKALAWRKYPPAVVETVRKEYLTSSGPDLAKRLGLSTVQLYRVAHRLGLRRIPDCRPLYPQVKALHAKGLPDRLVAKQLGITHDKAKEIRRVRLKLPRNPDIEGKRASVTNQMKSLGIRHGGDLRALAYKRFAVENGWPEDLRPREVQILNVLAAKGVPMTRFELATAIGMRTDRIGGNGGLALLIGNGPGGTYTASLTRRGLLSRIKRVVSGKGKGTSRDLYYLGPAALTILEERARGTTLSQAQ